MFWASSREAACAAVISMSARVQTRLCPFPAVWLWASYPTFLCLFTHSHSVKVALIMARVVERITQMGKVGPQRAAVPFGYKLPPVGEPLCQLQLGGLCDTGPPEGAPHPLAWRAWLCFPGWRGRRGKIPQPAGTTRS